MEFNICDILVIQDSVGGVQREVTMLYAYYTAHKLKHIFDICKEFRLCDSFICRWVLNKYFFGDEPRMCCI